MFPILYENITAGTVPQHHGLGTLSDCISGYVEQIEEGSVNELWMEYPKTGIHAEEIALRRVIKAKPNFTDDPQLYRIERIGRELNGKFTIYARHIGYDLNGIPILTGTAGSAIAAAQLLQQAAQGYTITTDKQTVADFKVTTPSSVRSYLAGREGSFADVYGRTFIRFDNFHVYLLNNAGQDRGVTIRYGKNLLELSQEMEDTLYTHVLCFYKPEDEDFSIIGDKVATGLTLDVEKTLTIDCTDSYDEIPTIAELTTRAQNYINSHNLTTPANNITLDFVQSGELTNRVDLGDTVNVYYEALGITRTAVRCIRTKWDILREKYVETEFGDATTSLTDSVTATEQAINSKPSMTEVTKMTDRITGNLGGCVINGHDSNGDGKPDENLIMNTEDIATATRVIRSNLGGIGFSRNGYAGPYQTAIGFDGIVADAIRTGTLNADLIKAGKISDVDGKSEIDMATGVAKLYELNAIKAFNLLTEGDEDVRSTFEALQFLTRLILAPEDAVNSPFITLESYKRQNDAYSNIFMKRDGSTNLVELCANATGGYLGLMTAAGRAVNVLSQWQYGSDCYQNNANGDTRIHSFVGGNDDGVIQINDGTGAETISLVGKDGEIKCGQVKPSGLQQVELWNARHTTGQLILPWGFNNYILIGKVSGGGSFLTMTLPRAAITTTDQKFQFTDEADYYVFNARQDVDPDDGTDVLILTYVNRSGSGSIQKVYGSYT